MKLNFGLDALYFTCYQKYFHSSMSILVLNREAYPSCQVRAVTLSYDVAKLMHLDKER